MCDFVKSGVGFRAELLSQRAGEDSAPEFLSRRDRKTQPGGLCPKGTTGLSPGF
jgi:hypothetical protein